MSALEPSREKIRQHIKKGGATALRSTRTMHPKNLIAQNDSPNYVTLAAPKLVERLHRKIRRSKKLTKLVLKDSPWLKLASQAEALALGVRGGATLTQECVLPPSTTLTCFGQPLTRLDPPRDPTHFPAIQVLKVENAVAYGRSSLIRLNSGHLVHHDLFTPATHTLSEEDHRRLRIDVTKFRAQIIGSPMPTGTLPRAALFTDSVASNYAHWLTEVLPRVALYAKSIGSRDTPLIVDAGLHSNLYESLSVVLGEARTVYLLPQDRRVFVRQLDVVTPSGYVPYAPRPPKRTGHSHGIFSAEALWAVRDACKHLMSHPGTSLGKRIYVRRNSGVRKLLNDQQVSNLLVSAGFTIVAPEEFSFSEQVRIFSQAEFVIGATGAAMANLIFCPPGSKMHVLIAQHEDMPYWYWQRLADCIGIDLSYGLGKIFSAQDKGFHADFSVDIKHIEAIISKICP